MATVYINNGQSFQYNQQLGTRSIVEYTDGTPDDLSSLQDAEVPVEPEEQPGGDTGDDPAPDPVNPPDPGPDNPDPEPQPEPSSTITIESKCTSKSQAANDAHPARHVTTSTSGFCLTQWHTNFERCIAYSKKTGVPMFYVWSNGLACGHCIAFNKAAKQASFTSFMKANKMIWCWVESSDSDGAQSNFACSFGHGLGGNSKSGTASATVLKKINAYRAKEKDKLLYSFPFCGLYWYNPHLSTPKVIYDVITTGDDVRGGFGNSSKDSAANMVKWLTAKTKNFKNYNYDVATATFTIQ